MSPLKLTISILLLLSTACLGIRFVDDSNSLNQFHIAPIHRNEMHCSSSPSPSRIHISMTLDFEYLRGSIAAVNSILKHASCPDNIFFHFIASQSNPRVLNSLLHSIFPSLHFKLYVFNQDRVLNLISSSLRLALENPLNFARIYLADVLSIDRVIYLDSDIIVVDDIFKLWNVTLTASRVIGAPEYCDANFTSYFTAGFWSDPVLSRVFSSKKPCYFNTGVMVMDLEKWRRGNCRKKIENWMEIQREKRIYELGSLPPFLLVFGGNIEGIDHRWNQHGLGGDNFKGNCRKMHYGPYSLLHWSGKGKPWVRLDANQPCPVDFLWEPYDLYKSSSSSSSSRIRRGNGHHLVGFSSPD